MSLTKRRYELQKCNDGKNIVIWDNRTGECLGFTAQIKGRLNLQDDIIEEQQATINELKRKIEELEDTIVFYKKREDERNKRDIKRYSSMPHLNPEYDY